MRLLLALCGCLAAAPVFSQVFKDPKASPEARAEAVLRQLTTEEKIDYIGGYNAFYIRAIPRLGLPELKMTDGPVGTRNDGKTTAYPATILAAATWDTGLARRFGEAIGSDARARGVHILLAPGVNLYRAPMNGRNFEYLGEDPWLTSRMAVNYIRGVQSRRVVATVKHFAANNQEWDRHRVSSNLDERTLQELYLPAFRAAVQEAKVGAVMNSYNLVNGVHATQNRHLNLDILKGDWKFDGVLMSDWESTYDGVAAANGGLDLEMPSARYMNRATMLPALQDGRVTMTTIDDKVRRILRLLFRFGFYDSPQTDERLPRDNPESARTALDLARSGIVLLKNEGAILPLRPSVKKIAVIGPNADRYVAGGGSSYTDAFHTVSLLQGLQALANVEVVFARGSVGPMETHAADSPFYTDSSGNSRGLRADYFNNQRLESAPVATRTEAAVNHNWPDTPGIAGLGADHFSARYTGYVRPAKSGRWTLAVRGDDGFRLWVDGKKVIDLWEDHGATLRTVELQLEEGRSYPLTLEFYENGGSAQIALAAYQEVLDFSEALAAARAADVAIVAAGFDAQSESEGFDRSFSLPVYQDTLIGAVARANPNTVVVLNAGGNVDMRRWLPQVKGLLHAWYPGQEGGTALAEIISGRVNPSGKLPASFEKRWEDNPVYPYYYDSAGSKQVRYGEGLYLGYRYYDEAPAKPQFAFGYGLSYTTFAYADLKVTATGKGKALVQFTLFNIGSCDGAEVAQVYVHQDKSPVNRPYKELKGFAKVFVPKGGSVRVSVPLDEKAFAYYKEKQKAFGYDPGSFTILVGAASDDVQLKGTVRIR